MLSTFSFFDSVVHWFENFSICLTTTFRSLRVFKPFVRKIVTNKVCTNSNNGEGAQIVPGPPRFGVHVYSSIPIMNKHFFISVRKLFIVYFDSPASQSQYSHYYFKLKWGIPPNLFGTRVLYLPKHPKCLLYSYGHK